MEWLSSMSITRCRAHFRGNPKGCVLFQAELSGSGRSQGPRPYGHWRLNHASAYAGGYGSTRCSARKMPAATHILNYSTRSKMSVIQQPNFTRKAVLGKKGDSDRS